MVTTRIATSTSIPECIIENDVNYAGNNNINSAGVKQNDALACRSYCKSNYPAAKYFTLGLQKDCYCRSSNAGRQAHAGRISGDLMCLGELLSSMVLQ